MKIAFLLDNAYGIGGTIRSTVNLSGALARKHTVEVVSVRRTVDAPGLPFDRRVTLTSLIDLRAGAPGHDRGDPRLRLPSHRFAERADDHARGIATRLGDVRIEEYLRNTDADVVIATRPKLNDYLAHYGSGRFLRIGQEHLTREAHSEHVRTHQDAAIPRLDAFLTVSQADAAHYRAALPEAAAAGTVIACIPNSVPVPDVEPSGLDTGLIVAAGRLVRVKRYDRLLRAFALVAGDHPGWRLRLYGRGRRRGELRALIDRLGLYDRVFLMGAHSPIESEWAKGSIAAVSSDAESFGMTLVEAMHCGVPVVSTDCPYGPGEILTHGEDGLLTPLDDEDSSVQALAGALRTLIEDPELRHRLGSNARTTAARYAPERTADAYRELFAGLAGRRPAEHAAGAGARKGGARPGPPGGLFRLLYRVAAPAVRAVRPSRPRRPRTASAGTRWRATARVPRPSARARAGEDGAIAVLLRASRLPEDGCDLVLRPRHRPDDPPLRIPLPPRSEAVNGRVRATIERERHPMQEARWDLFTERRSDGRRKRVRSELVETASLLATPPPAGTDGVLTPRIPYTTNEGNLSVRAWRRDGHPEVVSLRLGDRGVLVETELYGRAAAPDEGAAALAVPAEGEGRGFEVPARPFVRNGRPGVSFELPYDLAAAMDGGTHDTTWELRVRPAGGGPSFRCARLLGDLADRKKTDVVPVARLADSGTGVRIRFTVNNNLSLAVRPLPVEESSSGERCSTEARPRQHSS